MDQKPDNSSITPSTANLPVSETPPTLCRTITLTDEPEQSDAFSGPHQRIAEAITGLIQPPDAKGISIGIEGSWGSGKSTVARLLIKRLESDPNIATVSFDAWAHEGDPLRRTFLETIIRTLQSIGEEGWVNRKYWGERIEVLANRREQITTEDSLSVNWRGRVLALTLLFVPIGGAFITAALRDNITFSGGPIAWKFLIGLSLTFSPLIWLLLSPYVRTKKSKDKSESDLLGLFFNKGPTKKTTITSKTVNPTSIEFETNFEELLDHALGKNEKRKLVLILDNLDRVDPQDALSIWSTLQTFLQHKGISQHNWYERFWVLVLYDFRGLSQLWEKSDNANQAKTALSFIDKSFQVRFEVPALVQSDWRTFLMDQLAKAFPDHTKSERHQVYRVLNTWLAERSRIVTAEKSRVLTIRELKLFVNQIGSVHRQWAGADHTKDTFALALIAYYVLLRRHNDDVIQLLFKPEFPTKDYQELLGNRVREGLAALAFNVEIDVAQQLLFSDKINNALTLSSDAELQRVASLLRRGFWEVFEQNAREWASSETLKVADAAFAIEKSGILNGGFRTGFETLAHSVTKFFCERVPAVAVWSPMDTNRAEGIAVILGWKDDLQGIPELQCTPEEYGQFTQALFKAVALGLMHVDQKLNAKEWLKCLGLMVNNLESTRKQTAFTTVVETLSSRLRKGEDEPLPSPQFELVLEVLSELQDEPQIATTAEKELTELADTGKIAAHARKLKDEQSANARAWLLYVTIRYSSSLKDSQLFKAEESTDGTDSSLIESILDGLDSSLIQSFVPILQRFKQTSRLFEIPAMVPELRPLVRGSLRLALNGSDANEFFATENALEHLKFVFNEFVPTEEEESVLGNLILERSTQLATEIATGPFEPWNAHLYLLLLKTLPEEKKAFASWCVSGLHSVESFKDDDLWVKNRLVSLAFYLAGRGEQVELGEKYSNELKENLEGRVGRDLPDPQRSNDENLAALIGPPESPSRQAFLEYLCDRLKRDETPSFFFKVFRLELTDQLLHSSNRGKVVELLPKILTSHYQTGLEWLKDTLTEARAENLELSHSNEAAWSEFKRAVRRALISERFNIEKYSLVKSIAGILNVRLPGNGAITFATPNLSSISTVDPTNLETEVLIKEPFPGYEVLSDPSWSPGGDKLAYISATDLSAGSKLFVFDSTRNSSTLVTGSMRNRGRPSWSPDGQTLAFVRGELDIDIHTVNLETKEERKLTKDGNSEWPNWSPDGTRVAFHRLSPEGTQIFVMSADGTKQTSITTGKKDFDPSWSPDGTRIAFARWMETSPDKTGIYLMNPDGSRLEQLTEEKDVRAPSWSPDGTKLLFQVGHGSEARIFQIDADGKNKKELTKGIGPSWRPLLDGGSNLLSESPSESTATVDSAGVPASETATSTTSPTQVPAH